MQCQAAACRLTALLATAMLGGISAGVVPAPARALPGSIRPFFVHPAFDVRAMAIGGVQLVQAGRPATVATLYGNPADLVTARFGAEVATSGTASGLEGGSLAWNPPESLRRLATAFADPQALPEDADDTLDAVAGIAFGGSAMGMLAQGRLCVERAPDGHWEAEGHILSSLAFGGGIEWPSVGAFSVTLRGGTALRLLHARVMRTERTVTGPLAVVRTGEGFSADAGLRMRWLGAIDAWVVAHDVAGTVSWRDEDGAGAGTERWLFPLDRVEAGVAMAHPRVPLQAGLQLGPHRTWAAGAEQYIFEGALALRVGYRVDANVGRTASAGVGLHAGPLRIDAALLVPDAPKDVTLAVGLGLAL